MNSERVMGCIRPLTLMALLIGLVLTPQLVWGQLSDLPDVSGQLTAIKDYVVNIVNIVFCHWRYDWPHPHGDLLLVRESQCSAEPGISLDCGLYLVHR